jgi:hypothetical protein
MSLDASVTLIVGTIFIPCIVYLIQALVRLGRAINRNTEEIIELKTLLTRGVEPRIDHCEEDIGILYDRTNKHGEALAALQATHRGK